MKLETFTYDPKSKWSNKKKIQLDSENTLFFIFGASEYAEQPDALQELHKNFPRSKFIGCSTAGEIMGTKISDGTLSIAVAQFEKTKIKTASVEIKDAKDSYQAGESIAKSLNRPDLKGIFVLSEGLNVNGSELVKGLNSAVSKDVVVTGGLAGDGDKFKKTWVLKDGRPTPGYITAVGFYGDHIRIGHGSRGGWDVFGPERAVTKSEANVLFELDNKPALQLYKEYLGDRAKDLPASGLLFPLSLRTESKEDKTLVRTILAVDEEKQSMTFAGDIPQGCRAQLMQANFDRLIDAAGQAGSTTVKNEKDAKPKLCVAISCVGRRLILGERTEEEVEASLESLPDGSRQIGYYSYGELSPYASGSCDLHNQTMTLTTFEEV